MNFLQAIGFLPVRPLEEESEILEKNKIDALSLEIESLKQRLSKLEKELVSQKIANIQLSSKNDVTHADYLMALVKSINVLSHQRKWSIRESITAEPSTIYLHQPHNQAVGAIAERW